MKINKILIGLAIFLAVLTSCENQDISYPDYNIQAVYFAHQYPVRTVELGEDLYVDNSMDNQRKVVIKATVGGVYSNKQNIIIDFVVDTSLCSGVFYNQGPTINKRVIPMPSNYYQLLSNQIIIPSGSLLGGVEVQLTDAFFADTLSLTNTYAIPLRLTDVEGADSILQGIAGVANPVRCRAADWTVKPQDFILYTVKYINPWTGVYLRRGTDQFTRSDASVTTIIRDSTYLENNELVNISTKSLTSSILPIKVKNEAAKDVEVKLVLNFSNDGTCTISSGTNNIAVTGTGKFVSKGEKNSFGGIDRDALYLNYIINLSLLNLTYDTKDTLVVRNRGLAPEYVDVRL